jgi:hypothetical protein
VFIGGKIMIECKDCKYQYDCERTYLGCCSDGKPFEEDEEEGE